MHLVITYHEGKGTRMLEVAVVVVVGDYNGSDPHVTQAITQPV